MDKSQFFYRTVVFTRKAGIVALADINNPQESTKLEEWFGIVISLADGKHTLGQLVDFMRQQYPQVPERLDDTLDSVIDRLLESKMLKLNDKAVELPYYLAAPIEQLDIEKAQKLIEEDGYTVH
ncbi:hypothetical protein NBRC116592_01170 [Colwellia sp. KU-HH00111]|uniref:hypothetical protein n=1 Tax=Colwellia sp. KU-HH00111 TaxID=3127652 RepID=UPI0031089487